MVGVVRDRDLIKHSPVGTVTAPNTKTEARWVRRLQLPPKLLKPLSRQASSRTTLS
jgi:hypothetical protein